MCMESTASCGRVGVVGVGLEAHTSWRSLGGTRVGDGAIEGPIALSGVCASCVRVPGLQAARGPGPVQARTHHVCMREYLGLQRPRYAVWSGLAWLPVALPASPQQAGAVMQAPPLPAAA